MSGGALSSSRLSISGVRCPDVLASASIRMGDIGEVWPDHVIENMGAKAVEHGPDAACGHPTLGRDHGQGVGKEGEAGDVIEMGMADQRVLDLDLLGG